jgi:hypothetical protein
VLFLPSLATVMTEVSRTHIGYRSRSENAVLKMPNAVFLVLMHNSSIGVGQRIGGACHLHLQPEDGSC